MIVDLLLLTPVVLGGAAVQSALGFGFSLIVAPLLLLRFEAAAAIPLLVALNLAISALLIRPLRTHVPVRRLLLLSGGALAGMPVGFWVFLRVGDRALRVLVGGVVLLAALLLAVRRLRGSGDGVPTQPGEGRVRRAPEVAAGAAAGALTTSIGVPGPALAVYASWAGLARDRARALVLTFYLLAFGAALLLQLSTGAATAETGRWALLLLPAVLLGVFAGHRLAPRLNHARFHALILVLLVASAANLLYGALRAGP